MQAFHDALTLGLARFFRAIGIVAQLALVYPTCAGDGSKGGILATHLEQGGSVQIPFKFILAFGKPFGDFLFLVFKQSLDVKAQGSTGSVVDRTGLDVVVIKKTGGRSWLFDATNGTGYVITDSMIQ